MKLVIVGNGVAGITCARTARQRDPDAEITVISGETDYFFSRTALMYSFMDMMTRRDLEPYERKSYAKQKIDLVRDWVVDLDASDKTLTLDSGGKVSYDKLVFAVGAAPNMFGWDGAEDVKDGLVHFVSMQDLDACERLVPTTTHAVVVGGGLIGIELVECLLHHGVKTTFLIREPFYWPMALAKEEAQYVSEHMREHGVEIALTEEMTKINVDASGRVESVDTNKDRNIPCQILGIAAGVHPATERIKAFKDAPDLGRGIIVDRCFRTSLPDVFACGDCAWFQPEDGEPFGELIWYSARRQGELCAHNVFGDEEPYDPPLFFNSSKFFELEYTTVGDVTRLPEGALSLYRKMPEKPVSQRIVHIHDRVIGFNMIGSRWNHEVLERWIHERRSPGWVKDKLAEAQYDVEFGRVNLSQFEEREIPFEAGKG